MSDSVRPYRWQPIRLPSPWDSLGKNTGVGCHFLLQCMKVKSESEVAQSCPTLSDPMDCTLPGSSVHGIFQARVLEWGAIAFSVLLIRLLLIDILASRETGKRNVLARLIATLGVGKKAINVEEGFPGGVSGKEPVCQCRRHKRHGFDTWVGKIPWRRAWQATPIFLPRESHGQGTLAGYSP